MFANKCAFALLVFPIVALAEATVPAKAVSSAPAVAPAPLTLGELASQARQRRIAEETKPAVAVVPPGMTIVKVPSTEILAASASSSPQAARAPKPRKEPPPEVVPGLLAIAKAANGVRYVELADATGPAKFNVGQVTATGWKVVSIGAKFVEISKPDGSKKPAKHLTLSVSGA